MSTEPLVDPHGRLVNALTIGDPCLILLDNFDNDLRKLSKSSDDFILRAQYTNKQEK
jgi:hypothetical protein